jgi:UDP-N-acetylglucosamine:LPS N-acetylglucosamine transferase
MDRFIRNAKGLEDELAALTAEKKELVNGQEVLEIVDSCFHCYASSFRSDAKVEAQNLFAELIAKHGE